MGCRCSNTARVRARGRIARALFRDLLADGAARAAGQPISVEFTAQDARLRRRMALDGRGLAWLPPTPS